jgi:hypothetical protein
MRLRVNLVASEGSHLRFVPAGQDVPEEQIPESARRFQCSEPQQEKYFVGPLRRNQREDPRPAASGETPLMMR